MKDEFAGQDLIALLDLLEPVSEPPPVSLWPETEAWIWIGLVIASFVFWGVRRMLRRRRANSYRRAALREVSAARDSPAEVAEILRRTALAAYSRHEVAGLFGDDWLAFLDRTGRLDRSGAGTHFREGIGRAVATAPYHQEATDAAVFAKLATRWVRRHRPDSGRES